MSGAQDRFQLHDQAKVTVAIDSAHQAYEMHLAGHAWPVIAERVGYASAKVCHMAVTAYLQKAAVEQTPKRRREALELEAARLDALQSVYWERARSGDVKAAHLVLKIISERIKLRAPTGKNGAAATDEDRDRVLVIAGSEEEYIAQLKAIIARRWAETQEQKDKIISEFWPDDALVDDQGRVHPRTEIEALEREMREQSALPAAPCQRQARVPESARSGLPRRTSPSRASGRRSPTKSSKASRGMTPRALFYAPAGCGQAMSWTLPLSSR